MHGMNGGLSSYPSDVARPQVIANADAKVTAADAPHAPVSTPNVVLPRILCVDDESRVVEGIRRSLRGVYDVVPAVGARAAMAILEQDVDFAVVISDLRRWRFSSRTSTSPS
jgi:PleD family two-component response regulator